MPRHHRVYVGQYDGFWSMSQPDWVSFLANGASGGKYDLDFYGKRIKRAPSWAVVYRPLDWTREDFQAHLSNE